MKTTKILVAVLGLFMMGSAAVAQEAERMDSIYGLEVSKENRTISFYSTYDMNNATRIDIATYDGTSNTILAHYIFYRFEFNPNLLEVTTGIEWIWEETAEDVYKVSMNDEYNFIIRDLIPEDTFTRIELYIEGEGFVAPSNNLKTIGRSNVLTFFFNPLTTSLAELKEVNKNYTYRYFLLSGEERKEIPKGVPFIQTIYQDGMFINSNKYLIQR